MLKFIKSGKYTWAHSDATNELTLERLRELFKFHPLDFEDIHSEIHDPKLDVYKNYLFIILNVPKYEQKPGYIKTEEIDIFIGKNFLVTLHDGYLKEADELFKKLAKNSKLRNNWLGRGGDFLLFKILKHLFKIRMKETADIISNKLNKIEEKIIEMKGEEHIENLAVIRRNVFSFRRIVDPQRSIIATLSARKGHMIREEFDLYFDDLHDYLDQIWVRLENYKETINGIYETNDSLLSYRTNKIIKALTMISVSVMPLSLLAGIFGMNIALPLIDRPAFIWWGFGILFLFIMLMILFLKKKGWF